MEWTKSINIYTPPKRESSSTVKSELHVEEMDEMDKALSYNLKEHVVNTIDLFIEKIKSQAGVSNNNIANAKLTERDLFYLVENYPTLFLQDTFGNREVPTAIKEIAYALFNKFYPDEGTNNKSEVTDEDAKKILESVIKVNYKELCSEVDLEVVITLEKKKLSDILDSKTKPSISEYNDAVAATLTRIEKVIKIFKTVQEKGDVTAYSDILDYLTLINEVIPVLYYRATPINNISELKNAKHLINIKDIIEKFKEKPETLADALKYATTISDNVRKLQEKLKESRIVNKTYSNSNKQAIEKSREQQRKKEKNARNNEAARIEREKAEKQRKAEEKKREEAERDAELAKKKANNKAKEEARHAKLNSGLRHLEGERHDRKLKKQAYKGYAAMTKEVRDAENALAAKEREAAKGLPTGVGLKSRMAAFTKQPPTTPSKLSARAPESVVNQNYSELLKSFFNWLSEQLDLISMVVPGDQDKFTKFISGGIINKIAKQERFVGDTNASAFLSKIKIYIERKGGVPDMIEKWKNSTQNKITHAEEQFLTATINNSILVQTSRGGSGKMLTKRRKLSKRLQTKKRRV
jgi:hypothetical protein